MKGTESQPVSRVVSMPRTGAAPRTTFAVGRLTRRTREMQVLPSAPRHRPTPGRTPARPETVH